jgi:hypothetical protein
VRVVRRENATLYCTMMSGLLASVELCDWQSASSAFRWCARARPARLALARARAPGLAET